MGRVNHSQGKRRREAEKARKAREKAERKRQRKLEGGGGVEIASVEDIQTAAFDTTVEEALDGNKEREAGGNSGPPCRLFVGGLSWDTESDALRDLFAKVGAVVDAMIVTDRDTGDSRGFGFVTMANRKDATKAMKELGGTELDGRSIRIDLATER